MLLYTTGTINEPDAGSVGLTMAEKIRDDLVAHAAWVLEEEFTAASGVVRWYVFRCLATESGLPADFFMVMGRTLATGQLKWTICEDYTVATHTMRYFPVAGASNNIAFDASGRRDTTFVLGTAQLAYSTGQPKPQDWTPGGTSTKWWIVAGEDRFWVAFNGASNGFFGCGVYEWLGAAANNMPIQALGSSNSDGGICRNPAVAGVTARDWALSFLGGGGSSVPSGEILGFRGDLRYNDKAQGNNRPVAEQGMTVYQGVATQQPDTGWAIGKQRGMRVGGGSAPTGFAFGDAYALDGNLWVPYRPDDLRVWDTGVAA